MESTFRRLPILPSDPDEVTEDIDVKYKDAAVSYENYREDVRQGSLGKTAQF